MRILLLAHSFNSLTQRLWVALGELGHDVTCEFDVNDAVTTEAVALARPDLIVAPFLKRAIPEAVWRDHLCLVVHPGPPGDRGPAALDWAILDGRETWGITVLQAEAEMDAGPVWASRTFPMRPATKSSLYRNEVADAAVDAVVEAVGKTAPQAPDTATLPDGTTGWKPAMKQADRAIDWTRDDTATVLRKIRSADGTPGLLDRINGREVYLHDAHAATGLDGEPGALIARSGDAVARATTDGAVWIGHLRLKQPHALKLPAATVLAGLPEQGNRVKDCVPSPACGRGWRGEAETGEGACVRTPSGIISRPPDPHPAPLPQAGEGEIRHSSFTRFLDLPELPGYHDIWYDERHGVGYLHFPFVNGAMSTERCQRLAAAFRKAASRPTKVIVLMGGPDFWSNGIHLCTIESATSPAEDSWRNINAMNDLCREIITCGSHLTIAAMHGNAGAGGVFMALAADLVLARDGVVLNPHYKGMGNLYGSEYWTYLLPRRCGADKAREVIEARLPMGTAEAERLGLIDSHFGASIAEFRGLVEDMAEAHAADPALDERLIAKRLARAADEADKPLEAYRAEELEHMKLNFYGFDPSYHVARYNFIHKVPKSRTPLYLARHRRIGTGKGH